MNNDKQFTDTERLDWLAEQGVRVKRTMSGQFFIYGGGGVKVYPTFREAIDAEMAREESK